MSRPRRAPAMLAIAALMLANIGVAPAAAQEPAPDLYGASGAGVHADAVRSLGQAGVLEDTQCEAATWCWSEPITRETAAVWLVRVLDGDDARIPPGGTRFEDVDADNPWAGHIERLAQLEVTVGCSTERLRFCGDSTVTRAQMASFLTRGFDLEPADPAGFADTSGSVHAADIDALFAAGITMGCSTDLLRFCPSGHTTRAEMASFLDRARQHTANDTHSDEATTSLGGGGGGTPSGGGAPPTGGAPSGGRAPSGGGAPGATPPREAQPPESQRPGNASWLEVVQHGIDAVSVSWRPPSSTGASPISEYRLWWSRDDRFPETPQATVPASQTSHVISGLEAGDYSLRVAAVNDAGQGAWNGWAFEVLAVSVRPGLDWMDILWPHEPAASRFVVLWKPATDAGWDTAQQEDAASGTTSHSVSGLLRGGRYRVRFSALDADSGVLWSQEADARLDSLTFPSTVLERTPGSLRLRWRHPTAVSAAPRQIAVEWRTHDQTYSAERRATYEALNSTIHDGQREEDLGVEGYDRSAHYWVRITGLDDRGRAMSVREFTTLDHLLVEAGPTSIHAIWPATSGAAGYEVQVKDSAETEWDNPQSAQLPAVPTSYIITGLKTATRFDIRVRAITTNTAPEWLRATTTTPDAKPRHLVLWPYHNYIYLTWSRAPAHRLVAGYQVHWRGPDEEYDNSRRVVQNHYFKAGISVAGDTEWSIRVSSFDSGGNILGAIEGVVLPKSASAYIENDVVPEYEGDWPWVRRAWDMPLDVTVDEHTATQPSGYQAGWFHRTAAVQTSSGFEWTGLLRGMSIDLTWYLYRRHSLILHELAHHYTGDHRLDDGHEAVAAGWMYFEDAYSDGSSPAEMYAEALQKVTLPPPGPSNLVVPIGRPPTPVPDDDKSVARSVGRGELPQWLFDTYSTDGSGAGLDLDLLWAGVRQTPNASRVAYGFRDSFGGFCSYQEAYEVHESDSAAGNPWVNGGCNNRRPQDLTAAAGGSTGEIDVSWSAPLWSTTPAVDAYVVQWKTGTAVYNTTDQAIVTDLNDLTHTITGLASGSTYTVRVAAVNSSDTTDFTDDDSRNRTAATTATVG